MKMWTLLDTAKVPGGDQDIRLMQRGSEFSIKLGRDELMTSRMRGSEEALARLGCAHLKPGDPARILIGGLGMGFTLRAALALLGPHATIEVAELVPAVVAWGRGPLADLYGDSLTDARVAIVETDVGLMIRAASLAYDAILLDVDNGPEGMTRKGNDGLYTADGLRAMRRALRPGGVLAVWSAARDASFTQRLRNAGFGVAETTVRAHGNKGSRHTIWVATRATGQGVRREGGEP